jgi:hypothetical protein
VDLASAAAAAAGVDAAGACKGAGGGRRGKRLCAIAWGSGLAADAADAVEATDAAEGEDGAAAFAADDALEAAAFCTAAPPEARGVGCDCKSVHKLECKQLKTHLGHK